MIAVSLRTKPEHSVNKREGGMLGLGLSPPVSGCSRLWTAGPVEALCAGSYWLARVNYAYPFPPPHPVTSC